MKKFRVLMPVLLIILFLVLGGKLYREYLSERKSEYDSIIEKNLNLEEIRGYEDKIQQLNELMDTLKTSIEEKDNKINQYK